MRVFTLQHLTPCINSTRNVRTHLLSCIVCSALACPSTKKGYAPSYKIWMLELCLLVESIQGVRCCKVKTHTYMWVFCKWNASHPLLTPYMIFCRFFYQLLPVMTCVGAWVVTEWSVSCLGNSRVITKSCLKFVRFPLSAAACGDLCRSVGRNRMVGFLPRQLTSHD